MRRSAVVQSFSCASALCLLAAANHAAAGGLEYAGAGATALGRGGAVTARADDPMVLAYNPAGLAELRGSQMLIDINVAMMSACVDPIGYYGWGAYAGGRPSRLPDNGTGKAVRLDLGDTTKLGPAENAYYSDKLDTVCMDQHVVPVPQLAVTHRLSKDLGIGYGMIFPGVTPQGQWGDSYGMVRGDTGGLRPAATRYMLLNSGTLGIFPTFGVGYRVSDWLRIGAAVEWGMIWADLTTMAVVTAGTSPHGDVVAHLSARDRFVPGATISVHLVPMDSLDIVAAFKYQDAVKATGDVDLTTGTYDASSLSHTTHDVEVAQVRQNMPWKLRAGVRYASRIVPRPVGTGQDENGSFEQPGVRDPLGDERWDIELDAEYQMNSKNAAQQIDYVRGQQIEFENLNHEVSGAEFPEPTHPSTTVEKHWKDQISLRLGGTYNVLPGVLGLSFGTHYENRGVDPSYMQVDYWPVSRVGLHGGVTFRVFGGTDLVFSYAHIFQETIVVGAPDNEDANAIYTRYAAGQPVTTVDKRVGTAVSRAELPPVLEEAPTGKVDGKARLTQIVTRTQAGQPPWIVNSGKYRSNIDVVAIGVHSHF